MMGEHTIYVFALVGAGFVLYWACLIGAEVWRFVRDEIHIRPPFQVSDFIECGDQVDHDAPWRAGLRKYPERIRDAWICLTGRAVAVTKDSEDHA